MSPTDPEPLSPIDAFLVQYEKDEEAECVRTLREYMDQFPGEDHTIGREYFRIQDSRARQAQVAESDRIGHYKIDIPKASHLDFMYQLRVCWLLTGPAMFHYLR